PPTAVLIGDAVPDAVAVDERAGHPVLFPHIGARLARVIEEQGVEIGPGLHETDVRQFVELGPRQLERDAPADDPQTVRARPLGPVRRDAYLMQGLDCARRETVAADLLAREMRLVDDDDTASARGEVVRGCGSRRTTAHDGDVECLRHAPLRPPLRLVNDFTRSLRPARWGIKRTMRLPEGCS